MHSPAGITFALTCLLQLHLLTASPTLSLTSRGLTCVDEGNNPAPCTCSCSENPLYETNVNPPYTEGKAVQCAVPPTSVNIAVTEAISPILDITVAPVDTTPWGPVGCLDCQGPLTGSNYTGEMECDSQEGCQYLYDAIANPIGCYCWVCSTNCGVCASVNSSI